MSEQLRDFQTRLNTLPQFQDQPPFIDEVVDELIQKHFPELADFAVAVPAIRKEIIILGSLTKLNKVYQLNKS